MVTRDIHTATQLGSVYNRRFCINHPLPRQCSLRCLSLADDFMMQEVDPWRDILRSTLAKSQFDILIQRHAFHREHDCPNVYQTHIQDKNKNTTRSYDPCHLLFILQSVLKIGRGRKRPNKTDFSQTCHCKVSFFPAIIAPASDSYNWRDITISHLRAFDFKIPINRI